MSGRRCQQAADQRTYHKHGRALEAFRNGLSDESVGLLIKGRSRLVADDNLAPLQDRSSHAYKLLFAGRQILREDLLF